MIRIAILDDEPIVCRRLAKALSAEGYEVETFTEAPSFFQRMTSQTFDIVFSDLRLKNASGLEVLSRIKAEQPETEVIIITGFGTIDTAVDAIRQGAYHYVTKPFNLSEIRLLAKGAAEKKALREENLRLRETLKGSSGLQSIRGTSPAIQELFAMVRKVAPLDCNILLQGASGTGKALVANAIHQLSPRKDHPFVNFNCGGFTPELITSELFGYEKGAFTGATATKIGLLESASGGTVFLDEIGEMPLSMQVKLLHVIQERSILRVGGSDPISLNIRIIAATNRDLKHEVALGNFREDLFYRLNVVMIPLPALCDRVDDIPILIDHFLTKYRLAFRKHITGIHPQALQMLMHYPYPGNVRELENIIERAVALSEGETITPQDLPTDIRQLEVDNVAGEGLVTLEEMERGYISKVLEKTGYSKKMAAEVLGIPRTTLWRKLKGYGLE